MEFFETIIFYALAIFISVFSVMTVSTRHILRSATYLLFVLFGTAGIYFLLGYTFLGSVQIMVYAGGDRAERLKRSKFLAGLVATLSGAAIVLFITLTHKFTPTTDIAPVETSIKTIGHALLGSDKYGYLLPFEAVSILLLACIIGGLLIARKR
jgi:NADH-quinone oxidoreductase subunit J